MGDATAAFEFLLSIESDFPTVRVLERTESVGTDHLWCCRLKNELRVESTCRYHSCFLLCVCVWLDSLLYIIIIINWRSLDDTEAFLGV